MDTENDDIKIVTHEELEEKLHEFVSYCKKNSAKGEALYDFGRGAALFCDILVHGAQIENVKFIASFLKFGDHSSVEDIPNEANDESSDKAYIKKKKEEAEQVIDELIHEAPVLLYVQSGISSFIHMLDEDMSPDEFRSDVLARTAIAKLGIIAVGYE